jgi:hypothetical protein
VNYWFRAHWQGPASPYSILTVGCEEETKVLSYHTLSIVFALNTKG